MTAPRLLGFNMDFSLRVTVQLKIENKMWIEQMKVGLPGKWHFSLALKRYKELRCKLAREQNGSKEKW